MQAVIPQADRGLCRHQLLHRARHQHLAGARLRGDAGADVEHVLDDAAADRLIDDLVALKLADAFTPRGLDLAAVLSVLLNKGQLSR